MELTKVNKRFEMKDGYTTLYVQIVVPTSRAESIRAKFNRLVDWFLDKNKLKDFTIGIRQTNSD